VHGPDARDPHEFAGKFWLVWNAVAAHGLALPYHCGAHCDVNALDMTLGSRESEPNATIVATFTGPCENCGHRYSRVDSTRAS